MYSQKIRKVLRQKNIEIGNKVKIIKGKKTYEGILMPRIELGDPNYLILKLSNGYNIGIGFDKDVKIEKIGEGIKLGIIPTKRISKIKGLPEISIIGTGGTIGTHIDYKTGGVFMRRTPEEILATTPELEGVISIKNVLRPFTIASEDMTYKEWQNLAKITARELNKDVSGIIITHGTDTLHFTSAALSFMLKNLIKPVVLVAAQRSPDRGSFDGAMNLICGAHVCKSDIAEVCVVMHATTNDDYCFIHRGVKVKKLHASRRDAFRSINELPIGKVWPNGKIEIINKNYRKRFNDKVVADIKFEPKVALVKAYPGSNPKILEWYMNEGYRGIVIEGTGFGHVPTSTLKKKNSWLPHIKEAGERGIIIVIATQTIYGRTNAFVYRNLRLIHEAGAVYGEDMLSEVAYIKLGWLLGHSRNIDEIKKLMVTNLVGEITDRIDPRAFLI